LALTLMAAPTSFTIRAVEGVAIKTESILRVARYRRLGQRFRDWIRSFSSSSRGANLGGCPSTPNARLALVLLCRTAMSCCARRSFPTCKTHHPQPPRPPTITTPSRHCTLQMQRRRVCRDQGQLPTKTAPLTRIRLAAADDFAPTRLSSPPHCFASSSISSATSAA
jgi:hypothetical protein